MEAVERFCKKLREHYAEHYLAPSLVLSWINVKGVEQGYAAVHTFPNGLNSRYIVCKCSGKDLQEAFETIVQLWLTVVSAGAPTE